MTLGLKPVPQILPVLLIERSRVPAVMPEAPVQASIPLSPSLELEWYVYGRPCQQGLR